MNTIDKEAHGQDIEELLPWHAAGTLSRRDAQRVEQALAEDPELARRYDLVREELGETIHLNETLGAPSARAMETLFAKIDAEPARKPAASLNLGARVAGLFANLTPRKMAWSASAAAVVLVLQAGVIANLVLIEPQQARFETASAPPSTKLQAPMDTKTRSLRSPSEGALVLIRFAPQASFDDVNKFLEANRYSIVAGPVPGGLYKVRVSDSALPKDELGRIVTRLQANRYIGFIGTTQ
jgi:hypothetical protein